MKFISTNAQTAPTTFQQVVFSGLAADGGLFVPENIPVLSVDFLQNLSEHSLTTIATEIAAKFITDIPAVDLISIVQRALNFSIPLYPLQENQFLLELFHGPTLAFKDVGARFLAETLSYYLAQQRQSLTIIVATSGDTGSAVAHGFHRIPGINVIVLYPSGRISPLQEKQMTTLGDNIYALEIQGNFDDCQRLVKQALNDIDLVQQLNLTTANSISLGRLVPQISYYAWALAKWLPLKRNKLVNIVIPSGNFGNLTAAVYAKKMGIPIHKFIAATNANAVVPEYLQSGFFKPRSSVATYSNAMDVGNPSNFARLEAVYKKDLAAMRNEIFGVAIDDKQTLAQIAKTYAEQHYILDPHTAVGVAAAEKIAQQSCSSEDYIIAATAHPAKFAEVIESALHFAPPLPDSLAAALKREKQSIELSAEYDGLRKTLLRQLNYA